MIVTLDKHLRLSFLSILEYFLKQPQFLLLWVILIVSNRRFVQVSEHLHDFLWSTLLLFILFSLLSRCGLFLLLLLQCLDK